MEGPIIRMQSIELIHFKNVQYGKIELPCAASREFYNERAEILGLYGQNGSGKTAVIEAMGFLRDMLTGCKVSPDVKNYVMKGHQKATCKFKFYMQKTEKECIVEYSFSILNEIKEDHFVRTLISAEKLTAVYRDEDKWLPKKTLFDYDVENSNVLIKPQYRWKQIVDLGEDHRIDLEVAKKIAIRERRSYLFADEVTDIYTAAFGAESDISFAISNLRYYGKYNLFVINNDYSGEISLDMALPLPYKQEQESGPLIGGLTISLSEPTVLPTEDYHILKDIMDIYNGVIGSLIPGLSLVIKEYGKQMTASGKEGVRFEILTGKDEIFIPLRYESEGIKKILSVLNLLISMYNNPSVCVAIDELDAGVYEYLLGEFLSIIEESGQGQLIFTSHNLRPLEMINKESLIFTTTNPDNRYIKMINVKKNNNLRDLYLRSINLGGQHEKIYENTNGFEISRALRKAGRILNGKN